RTLLLNTLVIVAYFAFIAGLAWRLRKAHRAGNWAVVATVVADILVCNGGVLIGTPPEWYVRALILQMFTLQLTLSYFGWRAAAWNLIGVVAGFVTLLIASDALGSTVPVPEALWTLGLFTVAASAFFTLQGDLG